MAVLWLYCKATLLNTPLSTFPHGAQRAGLSNSGRIILSRYVELHKSFTQCFKRLTLVAKDYVEIALNGTYDLLKIAKGSSGVLVPLSSALGGVIACIDLYKVSSVALLTSTLPYSIHRERLASTKRWIGS